MNEQPAPSAQPYAGEAEPPVGLRIVAALIDVVILGGVFVAMSIATGEAELGSQTAADGTKTTGFNVNLTGWPFAWYLGIVAGYYVVLEALLQRTIGKMLTGLRVVSLDGDHLSLGQVLMRNVLRIVDGLPFLYLVGIITIAVSDKRQRIGDIAARTNVVRA